MSDRATRLVVASQVCLFGWIAVCVAITPHYLFSRDEGGMSNFGVHAATVVPYTLGFGSSAVLVLVAARSIAPTSRDAARLARSLRALGWLLVCVLVSTFPYRHGVVLRDVHIVVASLVICFETAVAVWIVTRVSRSTPVTALVAVQLCGFVAAAVTLAGAWRVLFVAQLLTTAPFGALLVIGTQHATRGSRAASQP